MNVELRQVTPDEWMAVQQYRGHLYRRAYWRAFWLTAARYGTPAATFVLGYLVGAR